MFFLYFFHKNIKFINFNLGFLSRNLKLINNINLKKMYIHFDSILDDSSSSILDEYLYLSKFRFQYYKIFIDNIKNKTCNKNFSIKDYKNDYFINSLYFEENKLLKDDFLLKFSLQFDNNLDTFNECYKDKKLIKKYFKSYFNKNGFNEESSLNNFEYQSVQIFEKCYDNTPLFEKLSKIPVVYSNKRKQQQDLGNGFNNQKNVCLKNSKIYVISEKLLYFVGKKIVRYDSLKLESDDFNLSYIYYFIKNQNYIKHLDVWGNYNFTENIKLYLSKYNLIFFNKIIKILLKKKIYKNLFVIIEAMIINNFCLKVYIKSPNLKILGLKNLFYVNIKYFFNFYYSIYNINLIYNKLILKFNLFSKSFYLEKQNKFLYKYILVLEYFYLFNMNLTFNYFPESFQKNKKLNFFLLEYVIINILSFFEVRIQDIYTFMLNLILNKNSYIKYLNKYFPFFFYKYKEVLFLYRNVNSFKIFKKNFYDIQNINFYNSIYNNSFNLIAVRFNFFNFFKLGYVTYYKCYKYFSYFFNVFEYNISKFTYLIGSNLIDSMDIQGLSQKVTVDVLNIIETESKFSKIFLKQVKDFESKWSISFFTLNNNLDYLYDYTKDVKNKRMLLKEFFSLISDKVIRRKLKTMYKKEENLKNKNPRGRGRPKKNVSNS